MWVTFGGELKIGDLLRFFTVTLDLVLPLNSLILNSMSSSLIVTTSDFSLGLGGFFGFGGSIELLNTVTFSDISLDSVVSLDLAVPLNFLIL